MKTVNKMSIITLVDISRSTPGKVFETSMSEKQYNLLRKKGKLGSQWKLKSEIKSISVEEVENPEEAVVEIVETTETEATPDKAEAVNDAEPVKETSEKKAYTEMSLEELRAEAKGRGLKFHHASRETKLIALLTEADNA